MNVWMVASTSSIIAGGTVTKGNCSVTEEVPGGVGRWWAGEEVGRYTDNSEEGVLVAGAYRSKELLDVVHCSAIAGGTVTKGNCSVTEEVPGGVGRWWAGEGVGRKILRKESWLLVRTDL